MLYVADDLSSYTLAAGEPFLLDLRLAAAGGAAEPLGGRAFVLSFHDDDRETVAAIAGEPQTDADGPFIRFARDGFLSEALYGMSLTVELAERFRAGRDVIATGRLAVTISADTVPNLIAGPAGGRATLVTVTTGADGERQFARRLRPFTGNITPTPTPVALTGLTLPAGAITAGSAVTLAIGGATPGSTITGSIPPGLTLDSAARTIAGTATAAGDHQVVLVETLAGASNSPRSTGLTITVTAQPTISLSASIAQAEGTGGSRAYTYTVTRSATAGAVSVAWTFSPGTTGADDFVGGYPAGGGVMLADGVASGQFTVTVASDAVAEANEGFTVAIVPPPGYGGGSAVSAGGTILNDDVAALTGFAANGAANTAFRAAVARVRAGTGRGRIVWKGDSITVGQGGGSNADQFGLTGARAKRIPAVLAALLSDGGTPTLDGSIVADNGVNGATGQQLIGAYDPRIVQPLGGAAWGLNRSAELAGGGFWKPAAGQLTFRPTAPVDTFEIVAYRSENETYQVTIDGAAPATGAAQFTTAAENGFVRHVVKAAGAASRVLALTGTTTRGALRSITGYDSAVPALDMIVHAALGASSAHQSATGSGWSNREALAFDAPDLTIVCLGLNDMAVGTGAGAYGNNLRAIVDTAKQSGDVLLLFPTPAGGTYNDQVMAYRDAAAAVAAEKTVAFFSLYDHYGPFDAAMAARMFDGQVHPGAALLAEIADRIRQALQRMAPDLG